MRDITLWLLALSLTILLAAPATALPSPNDALDMIQDVLDEETESASTSLMDVDLHWQAPSDGGWYVYEVFRDVTIAATIDVVHQDSLALAMTATNGPGRCC